MYIPYPHGVSGPRWPIAEPSAAAATTINAVRGSGMGAIPRRLRTALSSAAEADLSEATRTTRTARTSGLGRRQDAGPSTNVTVGITVGVVLTAFIALVFWFLWRFRFTRPFGNRKKRRRHHHHRKSTSSSKASDATAPAADPPADAPAQG